MTTVHQAAGETKPGLAIGGGVLAGLVTLALIGGAIALSNRSTDDTVAAADPADGFGRPVAGKDLNPGDCIDYDLRAASPAQFTTRDCNAPHLAEVTAKIDHPDAGGTYPGSDAVLDWSLGQCAERADSYLGTPLLQTTLADDTLLPSFDSWSSGDDQATCVVRQADASSLTEPTAGRGTDYPRGDQVVVSRLAEGDCFVPSDNVSSYELNSNSQVNLVPCDSEHNGVFFGRGSLDSPIGAIFPGEDEVGTATSDKCGALFEAHFGVGSDGFNYRYWRPNQQSWNLDDRTVLCAILDSNPLTEEFNPASHQRFFDLAAGDCFNLGPEETSESLRLDDQVRVLPCQESHVGQMIGSGNLAQDQTEPFPPDDGVLQLAGTECERLFVDFIGVSPYQSDLGNFPFWYPNEPGWGDGDRRYACAFLEDTPRSESLEGAER